MSAKSTWTRRFGRRRGWTAALALAGVLLGGGAAPQTALAWDPSVTHLGLVDAALRRSAVHLRWMAGSELTRGLFTPLRVDPERLTPIERRFLQAAILRASDATGSHPLGGPGSCPGDEAPAVSQRYCIDDEQWQMSAMAWIELGVLAELSPSAREVHHFIDPKDPSADSWSDADLPRWLLRLRLARRNGAPLAGSVNRTNFDGHGPSALAWLKDASDVIAPPPALRPPRARLPRGGRGGPHPSPRDGARLRRRPAPRRPGSLGPGPREGGRGRLLRRPLLRSRGSRTADSGAGEGPLRPERSALAERPAGDRRGPRSAPRGEPGRSPDRRSGIGHDPGLGGDRGLHRRSLLLRHLGARPRLPRSRGGSRSRRRRAHRRDPPRSDRGQGGPPEPLAG